METTHGKSGLEPSLWKSTAIGIALALSLIAHESSGQTYELVHAFRNSGQPAPDVPTQSGLIQASDGYLYGTSYWGGSNGVGTIFRIDSAGTLTTIHSFAYLDGANPAAGLVQATDGSLYGTATRGGANNLGTVFRMDPSGSVTRIHSFDGGGGQDPRALIQASDGDLYGTTHAGGVNNDGTVYRIDLSGTTFTTLHSFDRPVDGANPTAALFQASNGSFYGSTEGGWSGYSTLFTIDSSGSFSTIHVFTGADGLKPNAPLMQARDGNLYGTTPSGGANGAGTVFRINSSGDLSTLHSFDPETDGALPYSALIEASDGYLYGTTSRGLLEHDPGTVYRIDTAGDFTMIHRFDGTDGWSPRTPLAQADDGNFYGTTNTASRVVLNVGSLLTGTAFRMDSAGEVSMLHNFGWTDGAKPQAALTNDTDGSVYGTTSEGGPSNEGTIFRLDPSGTVTILHGFDGTDGGHPGRLVQATDGALYGSCGGGVNGAGSFFRMDSLGQITTLHVFGGVNGSPSDLIQAADGNFYGTTVAGGDGFGTAFRLDSAGNFAQLRAFDPDAEGAFPSSLIQGPNGFFYGTMYEGGINDALGTVFAMDGSGNVSALHTFEDPAGGYHPIGGVILVGDELAGVTSEGGDVGYGTVFKCFAGGDDLSTIHSFDQGEPASGLLAADSHIYGTTLQGANAKGSIFKIDDQDDFTTVHSLDGMDGATSMTSLIQGADGSLYGVARAGPFGDGVIFRLSTASIAVNETLPSSGPASGGTALDILGGGFLPGVTVTIGGVAGTDVTILDSTFLYLAAPVLSPGTLNDVSVTVPSLTTATATRSNAYVADFLDVPQADPFHDFVEAIFRKGVTAGCATGSFCPGVPVTRAQMAVFLLKAEHGSAYIPPACTSVFGDVACPSLFADWIERLAAEDITVGCGTGVFCPSMPVTRAQMAVFLLKTKHGAAYQPPPCTGIFGDVACPSLFAAWIEQLAAEKVTAGCGIGIYCPGSPNTRGQMAVFLVKTFGF